MAASQSKKEDGSASHIESGGQVLVSALRVHGVDRIFCVPGESYLAVLDALHDVPEIEVISARHEGAAANMAEADGKLTGRPGICFVTRGPGATHASVGVHTAFQDSTPMVLFIGQVDQMACDREGFQEVDFRAMFAPLAKWTARIDDASRIPEYIARAFHTAMSGRRGPVVIELPENILTQTATQAATAAAKSPPSEFGHAAPRKSDIMLMVDMLAKSERPLLVVGGTGWSDSGALSLRSFAERSGLPLVSSFRRQDIIDNRHDNYCGHLGLGVDPALSERVKSADLIVAIGSRLGENTTSGYTLLTVPVPNQQLIHVHPDPNELGRVFQPRLCINSSLSDFGAALADIALPSSETRTVWLKEARRAYMEFSTPPPPSNAYVDLSSVVGWLSENLPPDALISNGAGNYTVWLHRYYRYRQRATELAPTSGAMGYGVPAAIAAKLRYPDRDVVALAGDGCFLMYPQELATAIQHNVGIMILIANNGIYGTIRMHQERRYPGRVVATNLINPDFVALARSFGAFGELVASTTDFPKAFERARAAGRAAILELRTDPNQLTPSFRLSNADHKQLRPHFRLSDASALPARADHDCRYRSDLPGLVTLDTSAPYDGL